ncbi:hypothetical protein HYS79_01955 [Patescibacteria group bacterium]|nr:hypothetical protein [Patescibacteria group bacterium]
MFETEPFSPEPPRSCRTLIVGLLRKLRPRKKQNLLSEESPADRLACGALITHFAGRNAVAKRCIIANCKALKAPKPYRRARVLVARLQEPKPSVNLFITGAAIIGHALARERRKGQDSAPWPTEALKCAREVSMWLEFGSVYATHTHSKLGLNECRVKKLEEQFRALLHWCESQ